MTLRILIAAAVLAFTAMASSAQGKARFGFNDDGEHIAAAGNLIERSGSEIVRVPLYWPSLERQLGNWDFSLSDRIYRQLTKAGVRPLFAMYGTPEYDLNSLVQIPDGYGSGPRDEGTWQHMWRTVAARYPRAIFQVWNEPNIPQYGDLSPERMARLTNLAAAAVHEVNPKARVLGPPAAPNDDWRSYAQRVYARTDRGVAVAAHIYPRVPTRWRLDFRSDLRFAKRIAGGRRLWITETGLSRYQYGRALQKRGSRWIIERAHRARVASVIFHRLVPRAGAGAWDRGLAVTDRRLRPLPVFRVLRRAAARARSQ